MPAAAAHAYITRRFLTPKEAADYLRLSPKTLERYRQEGTGPAYHRLGRRILYSIEELDRFIAERTYRSTTDYDESE